MIDIGELYETRLIVMIETGPQTNKYMQVLLKDEVFKKVSEVIADTLTEEGLLVGDEEIDLPESFNSIY